jgi:UDP-N-acetylmuramate dehydrogenase
MLHLQKNRFLSEFSTFGIGGPIRYFAEVKNADEIREAFSFELPCMIIGKGSNCLFDDSGFDGIVLLNKIDFCEWNGNEVNVGSGYSFSLLGTQASRKNLSGLEFASGIPATVGGAVFMNAGANGTEVSKRLTSVSYLHRDGSQRDYPKEEIEFRYRSSSFQKMDGAILSATFRLDTLAEARDIQLKIIEGRMKTQPLKEKSAGCVFRNPEPHLSAGALIDRCGLKGAKIGGAKVSEIHANFIVNAGGATSKDVKELMELVQRRVFEQTQIHLEPEIWMLPRGS